MRSSQGEEVFDFALLPDLPRAVEIVRAAGFSAPDPAPGSLPGTHTSTVSREQTGGLNVQLLQYV